jgi:hypothetical protein
MMKSIIFYTVPLVCSIQTIIDQEVEKRLKEIFEQLKNGQSSNVFLRQQKRRTM